MASHASRTVAIEGELTFRCGRADGRLIGSVQQSLFYEA
jgi:hypothetical protein